MSHHLTFKLSTFAASAVHAHSAKTCLSGRSGYRDLCVTGDEGAETPQLGLRGFNGFYFARPGDEAWSVQDLEGHVVEALAHIGPHSGP